ncbi:MAG: hypothetical protein HKN68_14640, partial [Saprospiraceae bacterium]|nr:hypothetical protein [Saprospiraceae bacterium]
MSRVVVLCVTILFLCTAPTKAQDDVPTYTIQQQSDYYDLTPSIEYFEDENWIDIENIIDKDGYAVEPLSSDLRLDPNRIYWIKTKILVKPESGVSINNWFLSVGECDFFDVLLYDAQGELILSE